MVPFLRPSSDKRATVFVACRTRVYQLSGLWMARRAKVRHVSEFVLFDVLYEDGARSSNRKVPSSELAGLDGDVVAKPYIEAQDREIAEISGRPPNLIKSVTRSRSR
jgi:hypothetical protein